MKEVETDMREAAVRYFEGCLSAQDEERLYRSFRRVVVTIHCSRNGNVNG